MSLAMAEEEKRLIAEAERDRLTTEINELKEENYSLTQQNESYRSLAKDNAELRKATSRLQLMQTLPTRYSKTQNL